MSRRTTIKMYGIFLVMVPVALQLLWAAAPWVISTTTSLGEFVSSNWLGVALSVMFAASHGFALRERSSSAATPAQIPQER